MEENKNIEKFKRYTKKPIEVTLVNVNDNTEETFNFKPLTSSQIAKVVLMGNMFKEKEGMTKEKLELLFDVLQDVVKTAYPELDDNIIEEFVASNFDQLQDCLDKLMPLGNEAKEKAIEQIKKKQQENK